MAGVAGATRLLVIGGGQAAAQLIEAARQEAFAGEITLISEENYPPYQRPPLSKQYLSGAYEPPWLFYRALEFYTANRVSLILGRRAVEIDRLLSTVTLDDGERVDYDRLALATGARARILSVPGSEGAPLFYIRTIGDAASLRRHLGHGRRVVIVGGGFIGLEAAASLVQRGHDVTLLAQQEHLIPRVVSVEISAFLAGVHRARGVKLETQKTVVEIRARDLAAVDVLCADGSAYPADIVIVGIGALPNIELARAADLQCDDGIVVDEMARTSDPAVVAAGDCTNHPNPLVGLRLRLETVHNAVEQGRTAGATVAGRTQPYVQTPWVWSDQYDLRLQSVGILDGYDRAVLRGQPESGRFSVFYFQEGRFLGMNSVNQPKLFGAARRLLNARVGLSPEQAADGRVDLVALAPRNLPLKFDIPWVLRRRGLSAGAWGHA